jgi:hypothetical protein
MHDYRLNHPDYVEKNRQKQRGRNQTKRESEKETKIVKVDALLPSPAKTNTYQMTSFGKDSKGKIVKVDTLMVQLKQIPQFNFGKLSFGS